MINVRSIPIPVLSRTFGAWRWREFYGRGGAVYSPCERYRYALWRRWGNHLCSTAPLITIGLNPSTATECKDDPTIRRLITFAQREDCGALIMLNLFALRSPHPRELGRVDDPVGPGHDDVIREVLDQWPHAPVLAAWGEGGRRKRRDREGMDVIGARPVLCLGTTKDGHPRHPLYVRADTPLVRHYLAPEAAGLVPRAATERA